MRFRGSYTSTIWRSRVVCGCWRCGLSFPCSVDRQLSRGKFACGSPQLLRANVLRSVVVAVTTCLAFSALQSPASATSAEGLGRQLTKAVASAAAPKAVANSRVKIPSAASAEAVLDGPESQVSLGLPAKGDGELLADAVTTSYEGADGNTSFALQPLASGIRALVDIQSAAAPESYDFPFGVDTAALKLNADGSVAVLNKAGATIGQVDAPWAFDGVGAVVPTHFEVNGTTLTQVIKHRGGTWEYGITADPSFWWWTKNIATCAAQVASIIVPGKVLQIGAKIAKAAKTNVNVRRAQSEIKALGGFVSAMKKVATYARTKGNGLSATNKKRVENMFKYGGSTLVEVIGLGGCYTIYKEVK